VVTVTRFMTGFARFVARVFVTVLGAVFALVGLLLVLGVGLFGVAAALVLVAWARLRGRPAPPVRFQWRQAWVRRPTQTPSRANSAVASAEHPERKSILIDAGFLFVAVGSDSGLMVKAADALSKTFKA
jgi:hypothetical protein